MNFKRITLASSAFGALAAAGLTTGCNGPGSVFSSPRSVTQVSRAKSSQDVYSVFYSFKKTSGQGLLPVGTLALGSDGNLYGTTQSGYGCGTCVSAGTVFQANPTSGGVSTIFDMDFLDGSEPSGITAGPSGGLYVSTFDGGETPYCYTTNIGCGVLYKLTEGSGSTWTQAWLHKFRTSSTGGIAPSGPVLDISGTLYGVTSGGGAGCFSCGTLYDIGSDGTSFSVIHSFNGNPTKVPTGPLVEGSDGMLYGTTEEGGGTSAGCDSSNGCGVVYKIKKDGTDLTILHQFTGRLGSINDGAAPDSGVAVVDGDIYGTTLAGGSGGCGSVPPTGCGTIFKLTPSSGGYTETIIHKFDPTSGGIAPDPSGLLSIGSKLYGTTVYGGSSSCSVTSVSQNGCGRIFSASFSGTVTTLHAFQGATTDGALPMLGSGVIETSDAIWGVTAYGGAHNWGTVYSMSVAGSDLKLQHTR